MLVVLDASAAVELVLGTMSGIEISRRVADPEISLHVPELLDLEALSLLRHYERTGTVSSNRAARAFRNLADLDLTRHGHEPLLARMWARRLRLTVHDAVYVTLAEILRAPLLTTDHRLNPMQRLPIKVELFGASARTPPHTSHAGGDGGFRDGAVLA